VIMDCIYTVSSNISGASKTRQITEGRQER